MEMDEYRIQRGNSLVLPPYHIARVVSGLLHDENEQRYQQGDWIKPKHYAQRKTLFATTTSLLQIYYLKEWVRLLYQHPELVISHLPPNREKAPRTKTLRVLILSFIEPAETSLLMNKLLPCLQQYHDRKIETSPKETNHTINTSYPNNHLLSSLREDLGESSWLLHVPDHQSMLLENLLQAATEVLLLIPPKANEGLLKTSLLDYHQKCTIVRVYPNQNLAEKRWEQPGLACKGYFNLALNSGLDYWRLARRLTGQSIGLVLSGGGARGFIHLGVIKALLEQNIPFDCFGGCSVGAVVSTSMALGIPFEEVVEICRQLGNINPTGKEWNLLPIFSLKKGKKLAAALRKMFKDQLFNGAWYPHYCVATNILKNRLEVLDQGLIYKSLQATTAIPVFFPPYIVERELLVDGALMDNLPIRAMQPFAKRIIAIDLSIYREKRDLRIREIPSSRTYIKNLVFYRKTRYGVPKLQGLLFKALFVNSMYQSQRVKSEATLYLNPGYGGISFFDWHKWDKMIDFGYKEGRRMLRETDLPGIFPEVHMQKDAPNSKIQI